MATKTVEMMETGKYPLNPNAKETLDLVVTGVSERVGKFRGWTALRGAARRG